MKAQAVLLITGLIFSVSAAQTQPRRLITQSIDESRLVALHGTVHPLALAANDRGAVPGSFPTGRMLLMLNRPAESDAALQQFLRDVHTPGSASYHKWLTPEQFGVSFGPGDADIDAASTWLASHGLKVTKTSKSRQFVEFSGTAAALRSAFHTEIHKYSVNGETHYANGTEVKIPEALAGLLKGVSPMNDFRAQPQLQVVGKGQVARGRRPAKPLWTAPNQYGTSNPYQFTVAPEDLATQYDLAPLYQAGINGTGQTIAIINESNIDLSLVQGFQKLFGTGGTVPQVVVDGDDPGDVEGVDVEAYLDVELSGAVAPKANVFLYIASAGSLIDPLELAAVRAIEDNQASVLSVSFGECEAALGNAGNQLWASLWEQAAAQGQTVLVSSGDSGSVCFPPGYPAVSGLASTPWNVSVGGTDFYYSDYASGGASAAMLWNTTNDTNMGSLKAPLTEQVWNDPFGFNVIPDSIQRGEIAAGGGGASNCATQNPSDYQYPCVAGYAKPVWQTGSGVPADGVRDVPDLSLFASNGANLSAYGICAFEGECAAGSGENAQVTLVGGTSASAPAMAGIMALIDQKYGRQGQANYTLYPLAQQKPAAFHDVTLGGNYQYCGYQPASDPNCSLQWNGYYGTTLYSAGPGYDTATGLGSVDANVLVNSWNALSFQPTQTTLQLSSGSIVHGTPMTITASVAPNSGAGTPTGDVAILTNAALAASQSQLFVTLNNGTGSATSVNYLPGGEYQVVGRYGGDGTFASSTSAAQSLTVTPETAVINFSVTSRSTKIGNSGSVTYNSPLQLNIQPAGYAASTYGKTDGNATGSATFTLDSTTAVVAFTSAGTASWLPPALSIGAHTASASYSGDASFKASTATPVTFTVTKGQPWISVTPSIYLNSPQPIDTGGSLTVSVQVGPYNGPFFGQSAPFGTATPTGSVIVSLLDATYFPWGSCTDVTPLYSQTLPLVPTSGTNAQYASAEAVFNNLAAGAYFLCGTYGGDANWQSWGEIWTNAVIVGSPAAPPAQSFTALTISPGTISGVQTATLNAVVSGPAGVSVAPTGFVSFFDNGASVWSLVPLVASSSGASATASATLPVSGFWSNGTNQITAIYSGDNNYQASTSSVVNLTVNQTGGDFTLAAQAPLVTVKSGSTGTLGLNLAAINNFSGTLVLACTPSSNQFSCSVSPQSTSLNGAATATLTIAATIPGTAANEHGPGRGGWAAGGSALALCIVLIFPFHGRRRWIRAACLLIVLAPFLLAGCGGNSSGGGSSAPPANGTPPGTYTVLVTGTANGVVHNVRIELLVQ